MKHKRKKESRKQRKDDIGLTTGLLFVALPDPAFPGIDPI